MSYSPELAFAFFSSSILFIAGYELQKQPEFEMPLYLYRLGILGDAIVNLSTLAAGAAALASAYWGITNTSIINTAAHWLGANILFGTIHGVLKSTSRNFYDVFFMGIGVLVGIVLVTASQGLLWHW